MAHQHPEGDQASHRLGGEVLIRVVGAEVDHGAVLAAVADEVDQFVGAFGGAGHGVGFVDDERGELVAVTEALVFGDRSDQGEHGTAEQFLQPHLAEQVFVVEFGAFGQRQLVGAHHDGRMVQVECRQRVVEDHTAEILAAEHSDQPGQVLGAGDGAPVGEVVDERAEPANVVAGEVVDFEDFGEQHALLGGGGDVEQGGEERLGDA